MKVKLNRSLYFCIVVFILLMIVGTSSAEIINVKQVSGFGDDREIEDVEVVGNYAYVLQLCDLVVLSVTNPTAPVEMNRIEPPMEMCFNSITSSGTYIYVTASDYSTGTTLMIFDIADPTKPKLVGQYTDPDQMWISEVSNNHAYLLSYAKGCLILDVSNPAEPKYIGQYNSASYITGLDVSGQYLYLSISVNNKTGYLLVLDISNPAEPVLIGQYASNYPCNDVAVSDQYAFLANDVNGLIILDISDPTLPQLVGKCRETNSKMDQVVISGKYAYVIFDFSPIQTDDYCLGIVNISNPKAPEFVDGDGYIPHIFYSALDWCIIGAVSGNYIYMVPEYGGLAILQISPVDPQMITVSYPPTYDNRLRDSTPTTVLSTSTYVDIGRSTSSFRDVMMFDLSSYKTTDTISKATLSLYWYYPAGATRTSDTIVEVYRPLEWNPQYVTWNSRMSGVLWSNAGGSWFDKNNVAQGATPYASLTFAGSKVPDNKYYDFDVTQLVKEYVSGKYKNTGFFLKAKTESGNYIAFYSSEWTNAAQRPKLTVTKGASTGDLMPVANAGADKTGNVGSAVTFDGSASTDDKGIVSYSWDFDASNGITSEASTVSATKTYTTARTYTVTLTVTDTIGQKSTDTLKVTVSGTPPPTSTVSYPPTYDNRLRDASPTTVLSTNTYVDIGRSTSSFRDVMMFDLSSYKTTDTISKATLSLYWYYPAGATRTSDTIVEVYRPLEWNPQYVTWNSRMSGVLWSNVGGSWFDKNNVAQGATPYASLTFAGSKVPDNKYYDFDVTQLVQEYVSGKYKNTGFFLKAKTESGNYIAFYSSEWTNAAQRPKLTVTTGASGGDKPPVANAGADKTAIVGSAVIFDGSASIDDKGVASYSWDFDASNGITSEASTVSATKTYTTARTYTVTLTVTDTIGQKSTDTLQVTVSGTPPPTSTVSYAPTSDNRLRSDTPSSVLSTTTYLDIGKSTPVCRDVMIFDLSSYKTTDTISKATLSLYWYYPAGKTRTSDTIVEVYRPLEWNPQYVTWNSRMSGTLWTNAGGSWFDKNNVAQGATPYASLTFSGSKVPDNKYYDFDVTQLVKEYVSGKYKNTGFFLKAKTESGNYIAFYSSEWTNAAQRPKLTITR